MIFNDKRRREFYAMTFAAESACYACADSFLVFETGLRTSLRRRRALVASSARIVQLKMFVKFGVLLAFICSLLTACERHVPQASRLIGSTMGTQYVVTVVDSDIERDQLEAGIRELLADLTQIFSTYEDDSELSRLNRSGADQWIPVSDELYEVLDCAMTIGQQSDGAFDVTVGPLVDLWGFGPDGRRSQPPKKAMVNEQLQHVGQRNLMLRSAPAALKKANDGVSIDLSAIAKGYATDRVAALLKQRKVQNFLVDIGGELQARGHNPRGERWQIGLEKPRRESREVGRTVALRNVGLATSGNYRNFFEHDGTFYGHTIDPKSGAPAADPLAAVSVIHRSTMVADAWATALMSLGLERGRQIADERGLVVLFQTAAGRAERVF